MKCLLLLALTVASLSAATNSYVRVDDGHRLVSPTSEQLRQANPWLGGVQPQWTNVVTLPGTNSTVPLPANEFGVLHLTLQPDPSTNSAAHRVALPVPDRGGLLLLQVQINGAVVNEEPVLRWEASTEVSNLVFILSSDVPGAGMTGVDGPEGARFAFSTNVSATYSHGDFQARYHEIKDRILVWTNVNWNLPDPDTGGLVFFEPEAVGFIGTVGWSVRDGSPDPRLLPADGDWNNPFALPWTDYYGFGSRITNFTIVSGALPTNGVNVFQSSTGGREVTVALDGLAGGSLNLPNGMHSLVLVAGDTGWQAFPFPAAVGFATNAAHADLADYASVTPNADYASGAGWAQGADYANSAGWANSAGGLNLNGTEVTVESISINGTTYNVLVVP